MPFTFLESTNFLLENLYFLFCQQSISHFCTNKPEENNYKVWGKTKETSEDIENIYDNSSYHRIIIPAATDLMQGIELCMRLSGEMTLAQNEKDLKDIMDLFGQVENPCLTIWAPLTDEKIEGEFRHLNTGSLVSFLPWNTEDGEPQLDNRPNHAVIYDGAYYAAINASSDRNKKCTFCDLPRDKTMSMIGMCESSYLGKYKFDYTEIAVIL